MQALINRYPTVCGMTGTALAAGEQLRSAQARRLTHPPNTPNVPHRRADRIYITAAAKNDAIIDHIIEIHATGQLHPGRHPGRRGVRRTAFRLLRRGVPAVVLNAKNDEEEAA